MRQQARVRTESMAQRLAKKPMSEGFELWDKGYTLGSMRLFIFKAETSPPFQLGACLDAMGHLLARMDEGADAKENFGFAAEKYELIQQPILAALMTIKGVEATEGPELALQQVDALLKEKDPNHEAHTLTDAKTKVGLARSYCYRGELAFAVNPDQFVAQAKEDADYAAALGWDRSHSAHYLAGSCNQHLGNLAAAVEQFEKCIASNPNFIPGYEALIPLLRQEGSNESKQRALVLLDKAIELHPKSALIRDKAFALSETGNDAGALAVLDEYIKTPPHEETEALITIPGATTTLFLKAKAAILADGGKMAEALAAAQEALTHSPGDPESESIIADIKALAAQ